MKSIVFAMLTLVMGPYAVASDQPLSEIVCSKVVQSGSADTGMTVELKSNPTAWAKVLEITADGYMGPQVLKRVQVPIHPKIVPLQNGSGVSYAITYEGTAATLTLLASKTYQGLKFVGPAKVKLQIPGYEAETVALKCRTAKPLT